MNIPFGLSQLRAGIYAGIAVLFIAVLGFAGCQHQRAEKETAKRLVAESQRDQVIEVNKTNVETIGTLQKALDDWAKIGVTKNDIKQMLDAWSAVKGEYDRMALELARLKEKDDAIPECNALLHVDFQRVCPNSALGLRKYESRNAHRDRGSEDPGVRPPAGGTAGDPLPEISVSR